MNFRPSELFSTYSIVARDPETGQFGVAVQTHQLSVGRHVPWLLPGFGALATQSLANISYGPMGLAMLREGIAAPQVVAALVAGDTDAHRRQVAVVDAQGSAAAFTGAGCIREAGHQTGEGYSVQANLMMASTVVAAMADAYESARPTGPVRGQFARRLLAALCAAQQEGGDLRGMQSAALIVVPGAPAAREWEAPYDLRVDESDAPLAALDRLVRLRTANLIDDEGHDIFRAGDTDAALALWAEARALAPELEELAFWQAAALIEHPEHLTRAAGIFNAGLADDPLCTQWIDLLRRLQACGLIARPGAAEELIQRLAVSR